MRVWIFSCLFPCSYTRTKPTCLVEHFMQIAYLNDMFLNFDSYHSEQSIRLRCCKIEALSVWILGRRTLFQSVGRRHPFSGHRFHKLQSTETKKKTHDVLVKSIHHEFLINTSKDAFHENEEKLIIRRKS